MINTRLNNLLTEREISIRTFSANVGIDRTTFSRILNGHTAISNKYIDTLCQAFEVTSDYLLGRSDTGIKVSYRNPVRAGELYISESQRIRYASHINILNNKRTIIESKIVDAILEERSAESSKALENYSKFIFGSTTNREIIDLLVDLSEDRKVLLLAMLKSWVN